MTAKQPNILLILSDDHSVPHVGCYGSPNVKTPNLDRFAGQGMRFNRAYTTSPQCAPSRTSIFAGRSPVSLGVTRFAQPARPDTVFFTDILRANGYFAGLIGRHHHLSGRSSHTPVEREALEAAGLFYAESRFDIVNTFHTRHDEGLDRVSRGLNAFLEAVPANTPFFLYLGFNQPHRAWNADHPDFQPDPAKLELPKHLPDLPEVREDYAHFLKDVFDLDRGFGRIMEVLDRRGLADNTIVLFMGDNGEALVRGKGTLYNSGNNVPLLIRWPGVVESGAVTNALVSGEDLAGTLLEAVGLKPDPSMTSVSFLPLLKGENFEPRKHAFVERGYHGSIGPIEFSCNMDFSRGVVSDRYFFIYNTTPEKPFAPVDCQHLPVWQAIVKARKEGRLSAEHERIYFGPRPIFELYDLQADPDQFNNLADSPEHSAVGNELCDVLTQWMIREQDYLPLPDYTGASKVWHGHGLKSLAGDSEPDGRFHLPDTWHVFGPLKSKSGLKLETLKTLPESITWGDKRISRKTITVSGGRLDLASFLGVLGESYEGYFALVCVPFTLAADREIYFGCGADWWLMACIDGEPTINTLRKGNIFAPPSNTDHICVKSMSRGEHLLAVRVYGGKGGFSVALGATDDPSFVALCRPSKENASH